MNLKKIYYKIGGKKGTFIQRKWSEYVCTKIENKKRALLQQIGLEALEAMDAACKELGISFGLEFGTMLGAYRENGFIPFDDDIDLTMMASDCTREFENILMKYGFAKKRAFYLVSVDKKGEPTKKLTEIALNYKGLQVDIFFCYPTEAESTRTIYVYCNPVIDGQMTVRKFTLPLTLDDFSVTVRDKKFKVFSNPKETLSLIYGEDFMVPKENANATKNRNSVVTVLDICNYYGLAYILE